MKTNKSYTKRFRVTKNGKIIARKPGKNHFNAKMSAKNKMAKNRKVEIEMKNKDRGRFLARKATKTAEKKSTVLAKNNTTSK
jgi:ribosomal protein L35